MSKLHCKCCHHGWRPLRAHKPPTCCPRCRNPNWETGLKSSGRVPKNAAPAPVAPAPLCAHRETARSEYALFLARQAERDAANRQALAERHGHRRYFADEIEAADVRPPMLPDGTPIRLAKLTTTRRKRRHGATANHTDGG